MSWELTGNAGTNPSTNFLGTIDAQPLVIKTNGSEVMRIEGDQGVQVEIGGTKGLGFPFPLSLGIDNQLGGASFVQSSGELRINPFLGDTHVSIGFKELVHRTALSAALTIVPSPSQVGIVIGQPDITQGGFTSLSLSISDDTGGHGLIQAIKSSGSAYGDLILNLNGGNVGIGTETPSAKLTVDPQGAGGVVIGNPSITQGGFTSLLLDISAASGGHARLQAIKSSGSAYGDLALNPDGGNVGIGTISPGAKLEVNGDVCVTGDILLTGADCAEEFEVAEAVEVEPGTVVVLGQGGTLQHCQQAYDKRVAGVISGAGDYRPGLILDRSQSQDHRMPVALVGKAYCKVDAQYAAIEVGDLLTTSPTLGHAMKASDPLKAFGSVLGKALHSLRDGQGLIPILIALQ